MRKLLAVSGVVATLILPLGVLADATVTTPANVAPATMRIAALNMVTGAGPDVAGMTITLYYFDASGNMLRDQTQQISLSGPEITSFLTTVLSPVAGESGSVVKRYRQRVQAWLNANGKVTNLTPE